MIVTEGMWDTALRLHAEAIADGFMPEGTAFQPDFRKAHYGKMALRQVARYGVYTYYGVWDKDKIKEQSARGYSSSLQVPIRFVLMETDGTVITTMDADQWDSSHDNKGLTPKG